jgi:sulfoxide reductase heme-binding subunit YedZ
VKNRYIVALKVIAHLACFTPLARLGYLAYTDDLGANPIEVITRSTGFWTLVYLLVTLGITPLRQLTNWPWLIRFRRLVGLYAFFYACLHFTTYLWLDQFFDWASIAKDIVKRPFITVGFAAFVLLVPLALTSNKLALRLLTGRRWQRLHRLIYLSAICGVAHFWWLVKADISEPLLFGSILTALLGYRLLARLWAWRLSRLAVKGAKAS